MEVIGKSTIHPLFFYSGKIFGYIIWALYLSSVFGIFIISKNPIQFFIIFSYVLLVIGLVLVIISLFYLGRSVRLGLPDEDTTLKTGGIYTFSRNPIYLGFNLFTIASAVYTANILIAAAGIYSIVIYHFIILGEENFLEKRFGDKYMEYKTKVRRYM